MTCSLVSASLAVMMIVAPSSAEVVVNVADVPKVTVVALNVPAVAVRRYDVCVPPPTMNENVRPPGGRVVLLNAVMVTEP